MINKEQIIQELKQGETVCSLARKYHVHNEQIAMIKRSLKMPTAKVIRKILADPNFKDFFINAYNSTDNNEELFKILKQHPLFARVKDVSMEQRMNEIRNYFDLQPRSYQEDYTCEYDRIRGYIIRNTKFTAKRRGIHFDLKYTDFEIPEKCPILGVPLTYLGESGGNDPFHASMDRIDNSKGYVKENVIVISKLANSMKNSADFDLILKFCENMPKLIKHYKEQGALEHVTDVFEIKPKLSRDT